MSTPTKRTNLTGVVLDNVDDLGFSGFTTALVDVPCTSTLTSTDIQGDLASPGTVIVLAKLVSGALTIDLDKFATTANYGSADKSLTISNTVEQALRLDMDTTANKFGLRLTPGSAGYRLESLVVLHVKEIKAGEDWSNTASNQNMTASVVVGDGTGVLDVAPNSDHSV